MIQTLLSVALGGAIGSSLRFLVNVGVLRLLGPGFPWATLFINIAGSFFMGAIITVFAHRDLMRYAPFLMTGVLGGFTTFSAFSLDAVSLWRDGATIPSVLYVAASVVLSLAALCVGIVVARVLA